MKRGGWYSILCGGAALLAVLLLPAAAPAGGGKGDWLNAEGFRGLSWGTSFETARSAVNDLTFVRYELTGEKEPPWKLYERKGGAGSIEDVPMDEVRYGFRDDAFRKVALVLHSSVGPRTLETPAAEAFDRISSAVIRFAGAQVGPAPYVMRDGNRTAAWRGKGLLVTLVLYDPPGANREELVLEILKEGVELRRLPE